ncbi:hypothetical protein BGX21_010519, partial [Mortierella sp. AD011]
MALLLIANTVQASFAYCIGVYERSENQVDYAFHLWNDAGEVAHHVDSAPDAGGDTMSNNGWVVVVGEFKDFKLDYVKIKNKKYNFSAKVPFFLLIESVRFVDPRHRAIYSGCYDNTYNG